LPALANIRPIRYHKSLYHLAVPLYVLRVQNGCKKLIDRDIARYNMLNKLKVVLASDPKIRALLSGLQAWFDVLLYQIFQAYYVL
jgi:hypothetical protein